MGSVMVTKEKMNDWRRMERQGQLVTGGEEDEL